MYSEYRKISVDFCDEKLSLPQQLSTTSEESGNEQTYFAPLSYTFTSEPCSEILTFDDGKQGDLDIYYQNKSILSFTQEVLGRLKALNLQYTTLTRASSLSEALKSEVESYVGNMTLSSLTDHIKSLRTDYIQRIARPIVQKLYLHPKNAQVFNKPVDPSALGIPLYFQQIEEPMDLGTVRTRLQGGYYDSLQQCFRDVRLVFQNAIQFNGESHFVGKCAKELLAEFENEVKPLHDKCYKDYLKRHQHPKSCPSCHGSLCLLCGEKCLKFETPNLFCHGANCNQRLKRNAVYFISPDGSALFCQKCHAALPPIILDGNAAAASSSENNSGRSLLKKHLLKRKFDEESSEPWISCFQCGLSFHQICALVTERNHLAKDDQLKSFLCPICKIQNLLDQYTTPEEKTFHPVSSSPSPVTIEQEEERTVTSEEREPEDGKTMVSTTDSLDNEDDEAHLLNPLSSSHATPKPLVTSPVALSPSSLKAASLPRSGLSDFLEDLVKGMLQEKGFGEAVKESITIRVTSNLLKTMEVPRALIDNFKGGVPETMSYVQKCIQLFQTIDGVDVCLFCLYVHEFDASVPAPNTSTVYVAYLDSVDYFRPVQARSLVYQEIVSGYLLWSQARGFLRCMIWSCPPQRGDSFIFWCHPSHQKTPSRDRLNSWYGSIFNRSKALGVHQGPRHLWELFFRKYNQREASAPTREAAKRSFVGSGQVASKKCRKVGNEGRRVSLSSSLDGGETTAGEEENSSVASSSLETTSSQLPDQKGSSPSALSIPPIFDGDYWVMEFLKLHRIQYQKARMFGEQNSASNTRKCRDVLKSLVSRPHSVAFRQPVDPVALCIPSYPLIIKNPMDLGTIREKLRSSLYNTIFDFVQDVRLTFHNAMLFNPPGHFVHIQADLLLKEFEKSMEQSFQEEYQATPHGDQSSLDEFFAICKLTALPPSSNSTATTPRLPPSISMSLDCATPKAGSEGAAAMMINVITPTPFQHSLTAHDSMMQFNMSPKSVIPEDTENDYCCSDPLSASSSSPEKPLTLVPRIISNISDDGAVTGIMVMEEEATSITVTVTEEMETEGVVSFAHHVIPPPRRSSSSSSTASTSEEAATTSLGDYNPSCSLSCHSFEAERGEEREATTMAVVYPDCAEGSLELTAKAMSGLLSDLSKAIHRLNDDLFLIDLLPFDHSFFTKANEKKKIPLSALEKLKRVMPDTSDPDPSLSSPVIDSRYIFLEICQFRHFQFDSLRRAKHSSLLLLHYLLRPEDSSYRPTCSHCREIIQELRWHCEVCANYELCRGCKESLSKQYHHHSSNKALNSSNGQRRALRIVEWKNEESNNNHSSCNSSYGDLEANFHPHPLTPYRITIH